MASKVTTTKNGMINRLYWSILPVLILSTIVGSIESVIDSMFAGQCLGTEAMAVTGLFGPALTLVSGITTLFVVGAEQLCCTEMGNGDTRRLNRVFNSAVMFLLVCGVLITIGMFLGRYPLAVALGASGDITADLAAYIAGISVGILGHIFLAFLLPFLTINGKNRYSYLVMAIELVTDIALKFLFLVVMNGGMLGLGLSTALTDLLCTVIIVPIFLNRSSLIHLELRGICGEDLLDIVRIGSPILMFQAGLFIKTYGMNRALLLGSTVMAIAVVTVENSLCALLSAVPQGTGPAVQMLTSFYVGEGDRDAIGKVCKVAIKAGLLISVPVMALVIIFSRPILSLFAMTDPATVAMAQRMIPALCLGLLLNLIMTVFMKLFQAAGHMVITNAVTFIENAMQGILSLLLIGSLGEDAVWYSFPVSTSFCLLVIAIYGFSSGPGARHNLLQFLRFPADFGASDDQRISFEMHTTEEVMEASRAVAEFCKERGASERTSMAAQLCVEEMAGNVVTHGFRHTGNADKGRAWVLALYQNDTLTLRIRDNCTQFDPKEYLKLGRKDPMEHVGIRLVNGLADSVQYQNVFGMNMLTIKVES